MSSSPHHPHIKSNLNQISSNSTNKLIPLSQSFFNSIHNHHQHLTSNQSTSNHHSGLSRFLSTSFVNPIYRSKLFPSSSLLASENPLFYSTPEGYQIGLNSDEDILPLEDDHRLSSRNSPNSNPRGIDDPSSPPLSEIHLPPLPSSNLMANQESLLQSHLTLDEDPFYNPLLPTTSHQPIQTHPTLPRHLLASHALSNMMASEISYGNRYLQNAQSNPPSSTSPTQPNQTTIYHSHTHQNNNSHPPSGGWKIYQSLTPGSLAFEPLNNSTHHPSSSSEPTSQTLNHTTYPFNSNLPIPPELRHDLHLQSELTERPLTHLPSLQPQLEINPQTSPVNQNDFDCNPSLPTVFIYPTEARDIGSEAPGQISLGPQNYRDPFWRLAWLACLLYTFLETVWISFVSNPTLIGDRRNDDHNPDQIYNRSNNLMKTLPILALLITITFGICLCSLSLLLLVKRSIKYLVYGTILAIPSILGMVGLWTWSEAISDQSQRGMGYLSFLTIMISGIFLKFMWSERGRIDRTIQVLNLSISVVIEHPSLVVVSLTMSMACIILSIPFISLIFQLIINVNPSQQQKQLESILNSGTLTQVLVTGFIWSWSLNVIRNLQRIIISGVISHWYFNRHSPPATLNNDSTNHQKMYSSIDSTYQSISRAIGPSFGTVCLSGFLLTIFDSLSKMFKILKKITPLGSYSESSGNHGRNGFFQKFISNLLFLNSNNCNFLVARVVKNLVEFMNDLFDFLNSFTIVYSGITGFNFLNSFKKIQSLVFKHDKIGLIHNLLAKSILNIISLTMSLTISLIGYHIYHVTTSLTSKQGTDPSLEAGKGLIMMNDNLLPLLFVLFGLLPFWIFRFLTDLILNSIDTLFLCWNIDLDVGTNHSNKTKLAFIGKSNN